MVAYLTYQTQLPPTFTMLKALILGIVTWDDILEGSP